MVIHTKRSLFVKIVVIFSLFFFIGALWSTATRPLALKITTCDVGQGDGIIIQYGGFVMLVDTGPKLDILACLQRRGIFQKIDILLLTHNDNDHIGAAAEILKRYKVGELWWNGSELENGTSGNITEQKLRDSASKAKIVRVPQGSESVTLPGLRVRVVWSESLREKILPGNATSDKNAGSIGFYLETTGFGFLSLGDLECDQELAVAGGGLLNKVHLLKISHHGSKTSSCMEFLQKIAPEAVIIPVGANNSYGHPSPEILQNVAHQGSLIYRTDRLGDIIFQIEARGEKSIVRVQSQKFSP